MSTHAEEAATAQVRGSTAYWALIALVAGLLAGIGSASLGDGIRQPPVQTANMVGGLWLNALKMTVIPLMVALLIVGVVRGAEAARAGRIAGQTVLWVVIVCTASAVVGAIVMPLLTGLFPLPQDAAAALRAGLSNLDPAATNAPVPSVADFFKGVIPDNVVAAASKGEVPPLVVFALLFALAAARIGGQPRRALVDF